MLSGHRQGLLLLGPFPIQRVDCARLSPIALTKVGILRFPKAKSKACTLQPIGMPATRPDSVGLGSLAPRKEGNDGQLVAVLLSPLIGDHRAEATRYLVAHRCR
jgi:hypothetical protein